MPDLFAPFTHLVSAALAAAHAGLTAAGLDPHAGVTWALAIIALVVAVRLAVLPVAVHGVRMAHASASARPALEALRKRYAGRTDLASLQAMRTEQAQIRREHGMSALGCLPMLLQLPILFALYRVLSLVAAGQSVGAMDAALVASAGSASIIGVRLAERIGGAASLTEVVVLVAAGLVAAALAYLTQRWFVLPNNRARRPAGAGGPDPAAAPRGQRGRRARGRRHRARRAAAVLARLQRVDAGPAGGRHPLVPHPRLPRARRPAGSSRQARVGGDGSVAGV